MALVVDVAVVAVVAVVVFFVLVLPSSHSNTYVLSHLVIVLVVSTFATSASVVADRVVPTV